MLLFIDRAHLLLGSAAKALKGSQQSSVPLFDSKQCHPPSSFCSSTSHLKARLIMASRSKPAINIAASSCQSCTGDNFPCPKDSGRSTARTYSRPACSSPSTQDQ